VKSFAVIALVLSSVFTQSVSAAPPAHGPHGHGKFEFALIGDTPYSSVEGFERVLSDINANNQIKFVLHAGDIKNGSSLCSDELFQDRLERFQRFEAPFVLTPGDNEWTDCHRANNGAYLPLERLAKLRQTFFPVAGQTLGKKTMNVESQGGEFIENVRWSTRSVMFATLHIVGSNNAMAPFATRTAADDAEVSRRIAAAIEWIGSTYAKARAENAAGVLFLFQADPAFEAKPGSAERLGFDAVLTAMINGAMSYGRPVVFAHGDSHYYRVDKPVQVSGVTVPNITRVETFGSADYHWLRVVVDPRSKEVFSVHQEIVE
jgi:hypothetical protein